MCTSYECFVLQFKRIPYPLPLQARLLRVADAVPYSYVNRQLTMYSVIAHNQKHDGTTENPDHQQQKQKR